MWPSNSTVVYKLALPLCSKMARDTFFVSAVNLWPLSTSASSTIDAMFPRELLQSWSNFQWLPRRALEQCEVEESKLQDIRCCGRGASVDPQRSPTVDQRLDLATTRLNPTMVIKKSITMWSTITHLAIQLSPNVLPLVLPWSFVIWIWWTKLAVLNPKCVMVDHIGPYSSCWCNVWSMNKWSTSCAGVKWCWSSGWLPEGNCPADCNMLGKGYKHQPVIRLGNL